MAKKKTAIKPKVSRATKAHPRPAAKPVTAKTQPKTKGADTGSTGVQINFLTERINELVAHLRKHPKDFDSKRGLLMIVGKRRRLLNYLSHKDPKKYEKVTADLKLARAAQ